VNYPNANAIEDQEDQTMEAYINANTAYNPVKLATRREAAAKWEKHPSVMTGGKPFFYIRAEYGPENWGFWRVVWNRDVLAYAATKDQKYGGRPALLGYFPTVAEGKAACDLQHVAPHVDTLRPCSTLAMMENDVDAGIMTQKPMPDRMLANAIEDQED
jgi:hypothetical protein